MSTASGRSVLGDWTRPVLALALLGAVAVAWSLQPAAGDSRGRELDATPGPSIVLVTFNGLRADAVASLDGWPALTPSYDALAEGADFSGRAIAASSSTVASAASLSTGLQPWRHGALHAGAARLDPELELLPETLATLGYRTHLYYSSYWLRPEFGYAERFDHVARVGDRRRLRRLLRSLNPVGELVWIDLGQPTAPYRRHSRYFERLESVPLSLPPSQLPRRVRSDEIEAYFDPERALPRRVRRIWSSLYALEVAHADAVLEEILDSLSKSSAGDQSMLVVTSFRGEEIGDYDQSGSAGSLGRKLIEVPLTIRLAPSCRRPLRPSGTTIAQVRLYATMVECAGGDPAPGTAPSLFRPASKGVLSELYLGNGYNEVSWIEPDPTGDAELVQLIRRTRFAPASPDYYRDRFVLTRLDSGEIQLPPTMASLARQAVERPPFAADRSELDVVRTWHVDGTESELAAGDPSLDAALIRGWLEANGEDLPSLPPRLEADQVVVSGDSPRRPSGSPRRPPTTDPR